MNQSINTFKIRANTLESPAKGEGMMGKEGMKSINKHK
jgi:hypothetical protein